MALDLRPRRRSRALDRDPVFKRRGICSGSLTPGLNLPFGSAVGQIPTPQPTSTNLLFNTGGNMLVTPTGPWVRNGTIIVFSASGAAVWDVGFVANVLNTNAGGLGDFVDNPSVVAAPATQYTVSGQFTVDPAVLAIGGFGQPPSGFVRMAINWTGGVARQDSIDFNPATGQILGASAGVTNPKIQIFPTTVTPAVVAPVPNARICAVSFTTPATPAATNAGDFRVTPNVVAGAAQVMCGGFQVEAGVVATAFIPTPINSTYTRPEGTIPRQDIDFSVPPITITTANYAVDPINDAYKQIYVGGTVAQVISISADVLGKWFEIYYTGNQRFCVVSANLITGAGLDNNGVSQVALPYDGASPPGGVGPYNVFGARFTCTSVAPTVFVMTTVADAHGILRFNTNGNFEPPFAVNNVWIDGAAGGGGGGGVAANAANGSAAGGGSAGSQFAMNIFAVSTGTSSAITIGAGGNGGAAGANNGTAGGATILGAIASLVGGNPGNGAATGATGAGGASAGGSIAGQPGFLVAASFAVGGAGGGYVYAPSAPNAFAVGAGSTAGPAGTFGGGGSGAASGPTGAAAAGGNGGNGVLILTW